jgi:hypothetical protein
MLLSGSFGEIRSGHFHSGIDITTNETEGLPVYAAADGYVSRIKIAPDGYGKALYITHPNGFVTVYGHLQKFTGELNSYVKKLQYENKNFELDIKLKEKEFKIKKSDVIAYSGNSGNTDGPHLHFEIRDEISEEPINPMLFGIKPVDSIPPVIEYIRVYTFPELGFVNKTDTPVTYEVQNMQGMFLLNTPDNVLVYGNIAFGIGATDMANDAPGILGIYSCELSVDGTLAYEWKYDRFNFDDTKYVDAHSDYKLANREKITVERCFRLPGNHLYSLYNDTNKTGYQLFTDDGTHDIKITVSDFNGNKSLIEFQTVTYASLNNQKYQVKPLGALPASHSKGIAVHKNQLDVVIPAGALFGDFLYTDSEQKRPEYLSPVYTVGDAYEPIFLPITIGIKPTENISDSLKPKCVIVRLDPDGSWHSCGGSWNGKFLTAKSNKFGQFVILPDTIAPSITKEYVPADMNSFRGGVVQIKIDDILSGISTYSGMIDGKWTLFEYDKKEKMLTADIMSMMENKEHSIEMTVTDERGNIAVWKSNFYF